jgi:hypothetical protein
MSAVASILSIILFLAFATSGIQRLLFNPMVSQSADHLGFTKKAYQRIGALEIVGAIGLLAGLSAKGTSPWAILNELAAAGLALAMLAAVVVHLRRSDKIKQFGPALALGVLVLLELIFRLTL